MFVMFLYVSAEYVSSEKLERIAVEILTYESLCFISTQLHENAYLHNTKAKDLNLVLDYLCKCDLLLHVEQGIKTSRRSTAVFVKRLPVRDDDGEIDSDQRLLFGEKLKEFRKDKKACTVDEYLKKNAAIALDAAGMVTEELVDLFSMPEYKKIDISPLYNLRENGSLCSLT